MPTTLIKAIVIILSGVLAFDLMSIVVRILGGDYPILQVSTLRNLFGVIPAIAILLVGRNLSSLKLLNSKRLHYLNAIRSFSVAIAQFCFYTALTRIEFATATALCFSGPIFITILSVFILKNQVGILRWSAVLIGFFGIFLILRPFNEDFSFNMVLPVFAGFFYAISSTVVKLYPAKIPSATIQVGQQMLTFAISGCALILFSTATPPHSPLDFSLFILIGIFGGIGVLSLIVAYRLVEPSSVTPFEYFGLPISFMLGWLFFNEAPIDTLFPGAILILIAGLFIVYRERRIMQTSDVTDCSTKKSSK